MPMPDFDNGDVLYAEPLNTIADEVDALGGRATALEGRATSLETRVTDTETVANNAVPKFADPNADRIMFWDDSAGIWAPLAASTGLTISGTSMTVRTATESQTGISEMATAAETVTGTDTVRSTHPAGVKAAIDAAVASALAVTTGTVTDAGTGTTLATIYRGDLKKQGSIAQISLSAAKSSSNYWGYVPPEFRHPTLNISLNGIIYSQAAVRFVSARFVIYANNGFIYSMDHSMTGGVGTCELNTTYFIA